MFGTKSSAAAGLFGAGALAFTGVVVAETVRPDPKASFFITSANPGKGADFGGLEGADAHCRALAKAAGATKKVWRAYLSGADASGKTVNARDRIGKGPWFNVQGVQIASSIDDLHGPSNTLNKQTALNEKGGLVNGRGDTPNTHDILTGSTAAGRLVQGASDMTCANWSATGQQAMVGHFDRQGGGADPTSWNAAHASRGCVMPDLVATGGSGLLYCFAVD